MLNRLSSRFLPPFSAWLASAGPRFLRFAAYGVLVALLAATLSPTSVATTLDQAEGQVQARIAKSGADVAIAFRTLDGKEEWFLRADDSFHAASTMKIPVMIELFHQVPEGKLTLDDPIVIKNEFRSIVDGSVYKLDPGDDSEAALYKAEGQTRPVRELLELMITKSSNLATDLLVEKLVVENIRATVHALGADGMNVLRGVEDDKAYEKGLNDTTTARALLVLLQAIAEGQAVDADASRQMIEILKRQKFNEDIPAGLPPGIPVAHKTGDITKIHHDAAIVYAQRPFILVILTRGIQDEKQSAALMADITRLLYQAVQ
jgi:beta-lactamase class A